MKTSLHRPDVVLTNEFLFELVNLKSKRGVSWKAVTVWLAAVLGKPTSLISYKSTVAKLQRLNDKRSKFLKDKDKLGCAAFLSEPFEINFAASDSRESASNLPSLSSDDQSKTPGVVASRRSSSSSSELSTLAAQVLSAEHELEVEQEKHRAISEAIERHQNKLRNLRKK